MSFGRRLVIVAFCALAAVGGARGRLDRPEGAAHEGRPGEGVGVVLRFNDLGPAWAGGAEKPTSLKIPVCPGEPAEQQRPDDHRARRVEADARERRASRSTPTSSSSRRRRRCRSSCKRIDSRRRSATASSYDLLKSVGDQGVTVVGVSQRAGGEGGRPLGSVPRDAVGEIAERQVGAGVQRLPVRVAGPGAVLRQHRRPVERSKSELPSLENRIAKLLAVKATK